MWSKTSLGRLGEALGMGGRSLGMEALMGEVEFRERRALMWLLDVSSYGRLIAKWLFLHFCHWVWKCYSGVRVARGRQKDGRVISTSWLRLVRNKNEWAMCSTARACDNAANSRDQRSIGRIAGPPNGRLGQWGSSLNLAENLELVQLISIINSNELNKHRWGSR